MSDPQTLYALAAVITALSPAAVAAIVQTGRYLRSRRHQVDAHSNSTDRDAPS